jgi:hypothetical protein
MWRKKKREGENEKRGKNKKRRERSMIPLNHHWFQQLGRISSTLGRSKAQCYTAAAAASVVRVEYCNMAAYQCCNYRHKEK